MFHLVAYRESQLFFSSRVAVCYATVHRQRKGPESFWVARVLARDWPSRRFATIKEAQAWAVATAVLTGGDDD